MENHKLSTLFLFVFFILVSTVYFYSSQGSTAYDYFTRLADAFINGRYWLTEKPGWLTELIPWSTNMFFVPYAPMPALAALPFRLVFGELFEQQYLAHILGAGMAVLTVLNVFNITKNYEKSIWVGILCAFGSIVWYLSATGSSWYLGQITSAFFLSLAIFLSLNSKHPLFTGIFLGAAFLSRLHVILALPFFLYMYFDSKNWFKNFFFLGLGLAPFGLFNFYYNFIRFGTILDQAYFILPTSLNEKDAPWFKYGVFSLQYVKNNLETMFLAGPKFITMPPYIEPSWNGLAIWITSPAFIYSLIAPLKKMMVVFAWIATLLIAMVVVSHGGNGFAQFGYRFAVDFYPFLFLILAFTLKNRVLRWHHWLLLNVSIFVNLWGVIWINKFGWINF